MITSIEQCAAIQERRAAAGKRGYAKSVRNFVLTNHKDTYKTTMKQFKVRWERPKAKAEPADVAAANDATTKAESSKTKTKTKTKKKES